MNAPEPDLLVIGGGPAGVAAAAHAAHAGLRVELAEQRVSLGGAIHRQPAEAAPKVAPLPSLQGHWPRLAQQLATSSATVLTQHVFLGIDSSGAVMLDDRVRGRVVLRRPRALILALGAVERIRPRPGWDQAGVMAAGGLQVMLKEGRLPPGQMILAGSGPLLLALALQLDQAGRPPIAVIEAANPLTRPSEALAVLGQSPWRDMIRLMAPALRQRYRWLRACQLISISSTAQGRKLALLRSPKGEMRLEADLIALHDGLRPNDFGLPPEGSPGPAILRAGDMREVLGATAAEADGLRAAQDVVSQIKNNTAISDTRRINRERSAQAALAALFRPSQSVRMADLPDDTIICRCERRSMGDLRSAIAGPDHASAREIRLNGRFGMGACQGRFCGDWVLQALQEARRPEPLPVLRDLTGQRWPARPVSLATLAATADTDEDTPPTEAAFAPQADA